MLFSDPFADPSEMEKNGGYRASKSAACRITSQIRNFLDERRVPFAVILLPFKMEPGNPDKEIAYLYWRPVECHTAMRSCLERRNIPFIDASSPPSGFPRGDYPDPLLLPDLVHLNEEGHALMAGILEPFEKRLLSDSHLENDK